MFVYHTTKLIDITVHLNNESTPLLVVHHICVSVIFQIPINKISIIRQFLFCFVCFKTRQNLVFCCKRGFLKELFHDKYLTVYTERGIVKHQLSNFSALSWREQDTFPRDVLYQQQRSVGRRATALGHITLIPSRTVFVLTPSGCVS